MPTLLRPGSRMRQAAARPVLGLSGVTAWTPATAGVTYFVPGPATCFTDAGVTPAGVGDQVHTLVSSYGPALTLRQATEAARPFLRQTAGGKYYLDSEAGLRLVSTTTANLGAGDPIALAVAGGVKSGGGYPDAAVWGWGKNADSQWRVMNRVSSRRFWNAFNTGDHTVTGDWPTSVAAPESAVAVADGTTVSWYVNGSLVEAAFAAAQAGVTGGAAVFGARPGLLDLHGDAYAFGLGIKFGTLAAGDIARLDAFQRSLYA